MAEIVAAFGVPHAPAFPAQVAREGPNCETARLYAQVAEHVAAVAPDVLIVFTDDHFNTFFLDNFPTFAIGVADTTAGPNDQTPMPHYKVAVPGPLAAHVRATTLEHGFDIALVQDFDVDHAVMVPLHFLTPRMQIPVLPIFVNALAPPLPTARRCYALGAAIRAAVESWPEPLRVAVIGSGSFSLEIGGPKIPPGDRADCHGITPIVKCAPGQGQLPEAGANRWRSMPQRCARPMHAIRNGAVAAFIRSPRARAAALSAATATASSIAPPSEG